MILVVRAYPKMMMSPLSKRDVFTKLVSVQPLAALVMLNGSGWEATVRHLGRSASHPLGSGRHQPAGAFGDFASAPSAPSAACAACAPSAPSAACAPDARGSCDQSAEAELRGDCACCACCACCAPTAGQRCQACGRLRCAIQPWMPGKDPFATEVGSILAAAPMPHAGQEKRHSALGEPVRPLCPCQIDHGRFDRASMLFYSPHHINSTLRHTYTHGSDKKKTQMCQCGRIRVGGMPVCWTASCARRALLPALER